MIESNHGDVDVDDESRRCIYAWIDANVPYYGTWDMSRPHAIGGRDAYARTRPGMGPVWSSQGGGGKLIEFEPWVAKFNAFAARHAGKIRPISPGGGNTFVERGRINLTRPQWSPVLLDNLAKPAGGRADGQNAWFPSKQDADYQRLLAILQEAKQALDGTPRMDMPGGKAIPQERDFGRTFGAE
jgi:hypothetical protein